MIIILIHTLQFFPYFKCFIGVVAYSLLETGGTVIQVPEDQQCGIFEDGISVNTIRFYESYRVRVRFGVYSQRSDRPDILNPVKTIEDHQGRSYIRAWTKQSWSINH
ncbi:hypothetical protein T12_10381 [Trichinella patagoniensis]|uniref:Uncharacterized protein n=1 Tax=Trichinella patagoniensis TaxID=990121 RepID=A0A0V0Z7U8_9BILA|nr:hypothetical protein T12_10381 [Trichinella patagoniensis]